MDRRNWDLGHVVDRERLEWVERERLADAAHASTGATKQSIQLLTLVLVLVVILALIVIGMFTLRAAFASGSVRAQLVQMHQSDELGQPGISLRVFPRLPEAQSPPRAFPAVCHRTVSGPQHYFRPISSSAAFKNVKSATSSAVRGFARILFWTAKSMVF